MHINELYAGLVLAVAGAFLGLGAGLLYSIGGAIYDLFHGGFNPGTVMAFGAIIGMPVIFAVVGFAVGAIGAFLINAPGRMGPR